MAFDLNHGLKMLERTPSVLHALLGDADATVAGAAEIDAWARASRGPDDWSAFDVVGHLVDGEETDWVVRTKHLLEHGTAVPFVPFNRFRHLESAATSTLSERLDRFAALREKNLAELRALDLDAERLRLEGLHPALGTVRLDQLLATWTVHDLAHLAQISRAMARRWKEEVGPWAEYLSVLDD